MQRPAEELYDVMADPYCQVNLADRLELADSALSAVLIGGCGRR